MKLAEFKLERYFARYEFAVPYLLSSSDIEAQRMGDLLALADDECRDLWENLSLGYTESAGHPLLRREIASMYRGVEPDQVLVFAGAEEAIFLFFNAVLGTGDHSIAMWPAYQSLFEVARSTGADVSLLPLEYERRWALDLDALRAALEPNTRAIVVNFPHNPTGATVDCDTFAEIASIARESNAILFSDEVYRGLEHGFPSLPAAVDISETAVSLGVMSKVFALAGLRIGWLVVRDAKLMRTLAAFKDYTTICNSAPSEILALIALRAREAVVTRSRGLVSANLPHADRFFHEWSGTFEWVRPSAGCIAFPRLQSEMPIDRFAAELAETEGVMLLPSSVYDHGGNHFRLGFGRSSFPEALDRLERFAKAKLG